MAVGAAETIWNGEMAGWSWRPPEAVVRAYDEIDVEAARGLAERALEIQESNHEQWPAPTAILVRLACFVPGVLDGLHGRLLDQRVPEAMGWPMGLDPSVVYHRADVGTRDRLLQALDEGPSDQDGSLARVLTHLAWIGDDVVVAAFDAWSRELPAWVPTGYHPWSPPWPAWFPPHAGWTVTAEGRRRELVPAAGARLVEGGDTAAASVGGEDGGRCRWCGGPLTVLLDLADGERRLRVPTCEFCVCYGTVLVDVDAVGGARWSDVNERPDYLPPGEELERIPQGVRGLGPTLRSPLAAMAFGDGVEISHVGGVPAWIQDAQYPRCPRCGELMPFVGQVDTSEVAWGEGAIYAFHDPACGLAATIYQQT